MSSSATSTPEGVPQSTIDAVLGKSAKMPADAVQVKGYNFEGGVDYEKLLAAYATSGFQATNFGIAVEELNKMLAWRLSDEPVPEDEMDDDLKKPEVRAGIKATVFLGYTSNLISCGMRETILFLVKNKLVDVVVTTAGGIEEDFMKCMAPTYLGDFALNGRTLRADGLNRIGNLLVPNDNYCKFEDWMMPILDAMVEEQKTEGTVWTPSKMIRRLGKEIDNEESVYYWCYKNDIPVFCPALTDGAIGDNIFFHSFKTEGFVLDIAGDIRAINKRAMGAKKSGMVICGGGLVKHHICNANLMRNGADFAVFINNGQEFDGSDAGARPDEAISWGKIRLTARPVKIYGDATLIFPLVVAQTFAKYHFAQQAKKDEDEKKE